MISTRWQDNPSPFNADTSDAAERALLAAVLWSPHLLAHADKVQPQDFRSPARSSMFAEMKLAFAAGWRGDAVTLARRLDFAGATPPPGCPGWATALGQALEWDCCADDEEMAAYTRIVREASAARRSAGRMSVGTRNP